MKYPHNAKAVIDVTKAPYYCDNTGRTDCTEALRRAMNDVLYPNIDGIQRALDKLNASDDPNYAVSFEIEKINGVPSVIFPEELEPAKILYFPNGTYLVSDTIAHSLENLKNILSGNPTMEINRQIYIRGESTENTIIRLRDHCPGFGFGEQKPIISYARMERSNIAHTNSIADITIDCGVGNPGAVGLHFFSNNSGAIRQVHVKSSDPEGRGACGILLTGGGLEAFLKNVTVDGFEYGIKVDGTACPVSCENIVLENQRTTAFLVRGANVSVWKLYTNTPVNAFRSIGAQSVVTLLDGKLMGGCNTEKAVIIASGEGYIRNVQTQGYRYPLIQGTCCDHFDPYIEEFSTAKNLGAFHKGNLSLHLPLEETPETDLIMDQDLWACVDDYGAVGDGLTDSTEAIQKALNSGKPYVFFGTGHYLVDGTVTVPASVRMIDFMFCDFYAGEELKNSRNVGFLKVNEDSPEPLTLRQVFTWEKFFGYFRFVEHACQRDLVMQDLHTQCAGLYFNTVPGGRVFIENCACTMGGDDYCTVPPFAFYGQRVWAKNINPERGDIQVLNEGSDLCILGMKTESWGNRGGTTAVENVGGARSECFGVYSGIGGRGIPLYRNQNSDLSVFASCSGDSRHRIWDILVRDTQGTDTRDFGFEEAFPISWYSCRLFGYVSQRNAEKNM